MADMRIALIGQQAFGKAVLEALLERGEDVIAVYCAPDKEGARPDPLKEAALEHKLPLLQPASFKEPEVWQAFRELKPDLGVMAFVTLLVPEDFLYIPTRGTIQYHPSLLPRHRGPSSINWPIIQGAEKTGLSIFWPDNGLDTGPILLQKEVEIGENDTLGTVYFDKLFPLGVEAMLESIDLVRAGNAPKIDQDDSLSTYESWCRKADVEIDWSKPVAEVHNLIRGADPAPGAWTSIGGATVWLFDSQQTGEAGGTPGEIVSASDDGIVIACEDGQVRVGRVRPDGGKKVAAGEYASESGLKAGTKCG
jgi:methionyl-tRNA formyltransferase